MTIAIYLISFWFFLLLLFLPIFFTGFSLAYIFFNSPHVLSIVAIVVVISIYAENSANCLIAFLDLFTDFADISRVFHATNMLLVAGSVCMCVCVCIEI